jgi:methyl-accepting chemotaxis protein
MNWLKNSKMAVKLTLLISVFVISLVAVGGMGYYYLSKASTNMNDMYNNYILPIQWLNDNRNQSRKIEAEMYDLMLTQEDKNQQHIIADIEAREKDAIYANLEEYKKIRLDDFENKTVQDTYDNLKKYREIRTEAINLALQNKKTEAYSLYIEKARPVFDQLSINLRDLTDYRQEAAAGINERNKSDFIKAIEYFIAIILLAVLIGIGIGWIIVHSLTKPLKDSVSLLREMANGDFSKKVLEKNLGLANEFGLLSQAVHIMNKNISSLIQQSSSISGNVAASSEELMTSSEQSAQVSGEVSKRFKQMAASANKQQTVVQSTQKIIGQMSKGIYQVAENTNVVSESAKKTENAATRGETAVGEAVSQMNIIEKKTNATAETISELENKSKQIGQIVEAIASISGQTNLLALNAAIEAARAGEAGKGFAVVADEVRKLAEQSQNATKEIADLIHEVQTKTMDAVILMNDGKKEVKVGTNVVHLAGESFREIITMIQEISGQIHEIAIAIQEITSGSQSMVGSIDDVDKESKSMSEQTQEVSTMMEEQSSSTEEIAAASQSLAKMAETLQTAISKFKVEKTIK